jgi:hypothetical protein
MLGRLDIDIGGLAAGSQFDQLNIGGTASLGGTLKLDLIAGFTPTVGDTFQVLTCGSRAGEFGAIEGRHIEAGRHFKTVYGPQDVTLAFSQAHDGDANFDEKVDVFDLAILANNYGTTGKDWPEADFTGDSNVNVFDLAVLANNYGWAAGGGAEAIPEPLATGLLALGGLVLLERRRRGRPSPNPRRRAAAHHGGRRQLRGHEAAGDASSEA